MPPTRNNVRAILPFEKAHPYLRRVLSYFAKSMTPLTVLILLSNTGFVRRPVWVRVVLWRLAYFSYVSRFALVGLNIAYVVNGPGAELRDQVG